MTKDTNSRTRQKAALVLLHGFLCGPRYWKETQIVLSDSYEVITPTLPGFADKSKEPALDSIEAFADYVLESLDRAGIKNFHLLGHSMGGMIVQEVALKAGKRVNKLILFATGPNGRIPGRFESLEASLQRVQANGPEALVANTVHTWFMRGRRDPSYPATEATAQEASKEAILGGFRAMQGWSNLDRMGEIQNPTMIIWGDGDQSYRRDQIDLLHRGIPNSKLVIMPDCSHNAHLEKPELFHRHLSEYLSNAA